MDSSKFGKIAFAKIVDLKDVSVLVTDKKPEDEWIKALDMMGVECIYPES